MLRKQLAAGGASTAAVVEAVLCGDTTSNGGDGGDGSGVRVQVHEVPVAEGMSSKAAAVAARERATALAAADAVPVFLVVCASSMACTTGNGGAHAGNTLRGVLGVVGGRGGGKEGFAQGQFDREAVPGGGASGDGTMARALVAVMAGAGMVQAGSEA